MRLALGALVLAVIGFLLFLLAPTFTQAPTDLPEQQTATAPATPLAYYVVPKNLTEYVKLVDEYTSSGGANPALTWTYERTEITVPEESSTVPYAIEMAANQIKTGGGPARVDVTHFKVVGSTAYVLLNIDKDGWAGVSFAVNKIHPLVERTILLNTDITKVVFGLPPELKADAALQ